MGCSGSTASNPAINEKFGHFRMGLEDHAWISDRGLMFGDHKIIGKWTDNSYTKIVVS